MKKSRKLLCMLLALVMVVSLLPVMAFAADEDIAAEEVVPASVEEISPETAGIITDIFAKLPNYLVVVKTPWGTLAKGAQVVLYNQNSNTIVASEVATYGVAVFTKDQRLKAYTMSATWTQKETGLTFKSAPRVSIGKVLDMDVITVYPTFRIGLKDTDHDAYISGYPDGLVGPNRTLTRAEVRGGGVKPYRQKGTGRARQGSIRSPQFVKGGVVFAPKPRDFSKRTNKFARRLALLSALSEKIRTNEVTVIDNIELKDAKTKEVVAVLKALGLDKTTLIVTADKDELVLRAAGNLEKVEVTTADLINVYEVVKNNNCLFTKAAIEKIEEANA